MYSVGCFGIRVGARRMEWNRPEWKDGLLKVWAMCQSAACCVRMMLDILLRQTTWALALQSKR